MEAATPAACPMTMHCPIERTLACASWVAEKQRVFADVKEGDRLTGVATAARSAKFFYNGAFRGLL